MGKPIEYSIDVESNDDRPCTLYKYYARRMSVDTTNTHLIVSPVLISIKIEDDSFIRVLSSDKRLERPDRRFDTMRISKSKSPFIGHRTMGNNHSKN